MLHIFLFFLKFVFIPCLLYVSPQFVQGKVLVLIMLKSRLA